MYHPYHFNCASCGSELTSDAREKNGELLCLRCHDKAGVPICGACRRPIEGRVVNALGMFYALCSISNCVIYTVKKSFSLSLQYIFVRFLFFRSL